MAFYSEDRGLVGRPRTPPTCWSSTRSTAPGRRWPASSRPASRSRWRRSATASRRWPMSRSAAWSRSSRATGSWPAAGPGVESSRPVGAQLRTHDLGEMFWALRLPGPAGTADGRGAGRPDRRLLGRRRDVRARVAGVRDDEDRHRPARRGGRGRLAADRRRPRDAGRSSSASAAARCSTTRPTTWPLRGCACARPGGVVTDGWGAPLDGHRLLGSGHEFQMSSISAANPELHAQLVRGDRRRGRAPAGAPRTLTTAGSSPAGLRSARACEGQTPGPIADVRVRGI